MQYTPEEIETLKRAGRFDTQLQGERGLVADLMRDNLIVHVGKPVGSVTGWLGAYYWQVWVEARDASGRVHARINRGPELDWDLDPGLSVEDLLGQAKDRAIAEVCALRGAELEQAQARLARLEAAA